MSEFTSEILKIGVKLRTKDVLLLFKVALPDTASKILQIIDVTSIVPVKDIILYATMIRNPETAWLLIKAFEIPLTSRPERWLQLIEQAISRQNYETVVLNMLSMKNINLAKYYDELIILASAANFPIVLESLLENKWPLKPETAPKALTTCVNGNSISCFKLLLADSRIIVNIDGQFLKYLFELSKLTDRNALYSLLKETLAVSENQRLIK